MVLSESCYLTEIFGPKMYIKNKCVAEILYLNMINGENNLLVICHDGYTLDKIGVRLHSDVFRRNPSIELASKISTKI